MDQIRYAVPWIAIRRLEDNTDAVRFDVEIVVAASPEHAISKATIDVANKNDLEGYQFTVGKPKEI